MREIVLDVQNLDRFFAEGREMGARLDRGRAGTMQARLSFETMDGLLKVITPNRWTLLRRLRQGGPTSIRALAKALERDYRGVHSDVTALLDTGLVERRADSRISVPWSRITAEMALDDAA